MSALANAPNARLGDVYGLSTDTDLSSFVGCRLELVSVGLYQLNLNFDGLRKIGISIEGDYAVSTPEATQVRYSEAPQGAAALIALLGSHVTDVRVTEPGTTTLHLSAGAAISIYDSEKHYESYQIYIGDRLIVV